MCQSVKSTKSTENEIILELCKFLDADKDKIVHAFSSSLDLQYILGHLLFNRIGGIAYYTFRECELLQKINSKFQTPLKMIYDTSIERTKSYHTAEDMLANLFKGVPTQIALLKGAYLSQLYPVGLRTANNFDLLVKKKDIPHISGILIDNGFQQGMVVNDEFVGAKKTGFTPAKKQTEKTLSFVKHIGLQQLEYLEIAINPSLDAISPQSEAHINLFLENAEKRIVTNKGLLPTLSKTAFLVHLCAHLYKEAVTYHRVRVNKDLSLYSFCDIYLFITIYMHNDFAAQLIDAIDDLGMQLACYYTLYHTRSLFEINNKFLNAVIETIKPENTGFMKQITDQASKQKYYYETDFNEYIFHPKRVSLLKEA